jgi:ribonuclease HI
MPEGESPTYSIDTGIPQGSRISPILYSFYNADIADICRDKGHLAPTYIDDVSVLVRGPTAHPNCDSLRELHKDIQQWADRHASQFGLEKYNLIHFWPQSRAVSKEPVGNDLTTPLVLEGGHTIHPKPSAKLLGVILDSRLDWKAHLQMLEAKASSRLMGLAGCVGSKWGVSYESPRKLYRGMILPTLLFACSVWYTPYAPEYKVKGDKIRRVLRKIQKSAACTISGGFKNVAGSSLDVETFMLPIQQTLEKSIADAALRLQTCPYYQLIKAIRIPTDRQRPPGKVAKLLSPLEQLKPKLLRKIGKELEERVPYVMAPWHENSSDGLIAMDDDEAIVNHQRVVDKKSLRIYMDGSGINGRIGAAAYSPQLEVGFKSYLGETAHFTVYSGEQQGIDLAYQLITDYEPSEVDIFADNQAAIQAVNNPRCQSGQYFLRRICTKITAHAAKGIRVNIHSIPAHIGVAGNEAVDKLAKEATGWREICKGTDPPPAEGPALLSAAKQRIQELANDRWMEAWEACGDTHLKRYVQAPTKGTLTLHKGLPKAVSSVITQLRTKIALKDLRFQNKAKSSPDCRCRSGRQTACG